MHRISVAISCPLPLFVILILPAPPRGQGGNRKKYLTTANMHSCIATANRPRMHWYWSDLRRTAMDWWPRRCGLVSILHHGCRWSHPRSRDHACPPARNRASRSSTSNRIGVFRWWHRNNNRFHTEKIQAGRIGPEHHLVSRQVSICRYRFDYC